MGAPYLNVVHLEARQQSPTATPPTPTRPTPSPPPADPPFGLPFLQFPPLVPTPSISLPPVLRPTTTSSSSTTSNSTTSSTTTSSSSSSETSSTSASTTPVETTPSLTTSSLSTGPPTTLTVTAQGSATPDASATAANAPVGFLQNKVLSGVVFSFVGIVGLILIIVIGTFAIRRRRNKRLIKEAIDFDPVKLGGTYADALEEGKREIRTSSSSSSTGHGDVSWTTMPAPGRPNQFHVPLQGPGQAYAPPTTWATSGRYIPPSQIYQQAPDGSYAGGNRTQGY